MAKEISDWLAAVDRHMAAAFDAYMSGTYRDSCWDRCCLDPHHGLVLLPRDSLGNLTAGQVTALSANQIDRPFREDQNALLVAAGLYVPCEEDFPEAGCCPPCHACPVC